MNTLLLTAHPSDTSLNRAIVQEARAALQQAGHDLIVRDLYARPLNPILTPEDMQRVSQGQRSPDVAEEQALIRWADALVVVYPVWWTGMPAALKGYFDRVFTYGFAYEYVDGQKRTLLDGKQALIFSTTGATREAYDEQGMFQAMNLTLDQGIFGFCGVQVAGHHYYSGIWNTSDQERLHMLADVRRRVQDFAGQARAA